MHILYIYIYYIYMDSTLNERSETKIAKLIKKKVALIF